MKRPPRYDLPKAAPGPLRLVQLYVNTTDHEQRELLSSPGELRSWLEELGLFLDEEPPSPADLRRALSVREALRALLEANNTGGGSSEALATLAKAAGRAKLSIEFEEDGARLVSRARGTDGALGRILIVAFTAMADGSWARLKACRNCRWAFYDYSRNRAASWCSMALCGNRRKTRLYRRRRREDRQVDTGIS